MHDTTAQKPTPAPGMYTVWNPHSYTAQQIHVGEDGAQIFAAPSGVYPAAFLRAATLEDVAGILAHPRAQVRSFAPTIGKARACRLHRLMSRCGLAHAAHYAKASEATGRAVASLASLTEEEARKTWAALCAAFPQAPQVAA